METIVRHPYTTARVRFQVDFGDEISRAKQSFRDECDINKLLAKYQRTGVLEHVRRHGLEYGFAPAVDFKEAMDIVAQGNSMFEELPSSLRKRFETPEAFLEFVQDPENKEEMRELGLLRPDAPVPAQAAEAATEEPTEPPAEPT